MIAGFFRTWGAACITGLTICGAEAQTYSWAQRTGGDATGAQAAGVVDNWRWGWTPGGVPITGTVAITRTGAGGTFATSENYNSTIMAQGYARTVFNGPEAARANALGGVDNIYHFVSEGEGPRAANDVALNALSTTTLDFVFDGIYSTPDNTLIALFDPGSRENTLAVAHTYQFAAFLNGASVATTSWTLSILDVYTPSGNTTTGMTWNGGAGVFTVPHYNNSGQTSNYPDTVVTLNTGSSSFDRLLVTGNGLAYDTFAIGFGANTAPIPEPSGGLFVMLAAGVAAARRRR